jgi:hypothetical protein
MSAQWVRLQPDAASRPAEAGPTHIALSLISHTNAGKTTLARTLLGRDVGEVRDAPHVTEFAEMHVLLRSDAGDELQLWDTPGFGDSVRLARRLAQASNPIGWFLLEVWDRWRDRAFWSSQRAVRHILDEADVVLYLVNAAEAPHDAAYVDAELQILTLIGKPVIVLLNQLGPPRPLREERDIVAAWRSRTADATCVRNVLALDAFARCWVQEDALFDAVAAAVPPSKAAAFERLRGAWRARHEATFQDSMAVLGERIVRAARDREVVPEAGWTGRLQEIGALMGLRRDGTRTPREHAMHLLAARLDADIRTTTDRLIGLHGLSGRAGATVLTRLAEHYATRTPLSEGKAAVIGGVATGALAGLKADIASGGMTLGAGLLVGGVLGALGAIGLARGYNFVRGVERPTLTWSDEVLDELVHAAVLGYLAVAHYGRGRGEWEAAEHPAHWSAAVDDAMASRRDALHALWDRRQDDEALDREMRDFLAEATASVLARLYPRGDSIAG